MKLVSICTLLFPQLTPVVAPAHVAVDNRLIDELSGRFEIAPNVFVRVFEFRDALFGNFPGQ